MNKTCIVYRSRYYGNTGDVVRTLARYGKVDVVNLKDRPFPDLSGYKIVGLASGTYRGRMHSSLLKLVKKNLIPEDAKTFLFIPVDWNTTMVENISWRSWKNGVMKTSAPGIARGIALSGDSARMPLLDIPTGRISSGSSESSVSL